MKLEKLVAVTGMPGIYKAIANRSNGMIIENLDTKERTFAPTRLHQFTALESIGIYESNNDTAPLKQVFQSMFAAMETTPLVSEKGSNAELRAYFTAVVPTHDPDRVHIGDIKKAIKWFKFLNERGLVDLGKDEEKEDVKDEVKDEVKEDVKENIEA